MGSPASAPTLVVAVCAREGATTLAACEAALRAAGLEPLVFTAGAGRGLADARNAALEAARGADVLALLEDDVEVAPGWGAALERAWRDAPADCAVVGGPLEARFAGPRPGWVTDAQLGVLGVAAGATFHGANVSFRVDALLGVGGFWPARGRPELRDWFSEEHFAQHELARVGWSSRIAGDLRATRIIPSDTLTRGGVLMRRARYGARSTVVGDARPASLALRTVLTATAGSVAALATGAGALGLERAGRAAENAGALAGARLARRDLQPVHTETPFRHSVPVAPDRGPRRPARGPGPLALVYHRIGDAPGADVTPAQFSEQVEAIARGRTPVTMAVLAGGDVPRDAIAVTFDDAYAETLIAHALPVLERTGVPATVFAVTEHVATQRRFWWDQLPQLLARGEGRALRLRAGGETRAWARADARILPYVTSWLQPQPPAAIADVIAQLSAWAGAEPAAPEAERPVTIGELQALAAASVIDVAAHTRTHPNLRHCTPAQVARELAGSRDDLVAWLGADAGRGLAYPFGVPGADIDETTYDAARAAGFDYAVTNQPGALARAPNRFALPRSAAPALGATAFAAFLGARRRGR